MRIKEELVPLEQIDPIIRETIEDLKKKNPPLGDSFETNILQRALNYVRQDFEEVTRRVNLIDNIYKLYHWDTWTKLKEERPSLAEAILVARDKIDDEFTRFKHGKSIWGRVEEKIDSYGEAWRVAHINFPS